MLKNTIIALLAIGVLVISGCDSTSNAERADEIEDIVGTWKRIGSIEMVCRHSQDGALACADRGQELDGNDVFLGDFWFDDGLYHETSRRTDCVEVGVYEVLLLDNGNIKYELVEDECEGRVSINFGAFSTEGKIEWEPVL